MNAEIASTFDQHTLAALQARDIPRARAADYFSKTAAADAETDQALARWDAYLAQFARIERGSCICCGQCLAALSLRGLDLMIGGGFEWGVTHGEGRCRYCHYPMIRFAREAARASSGGRFGHDPQSVPALPPEHAGVRTVMTAAAR